MKILADPSIKRLFCGILAVIVVFSVLSTVLLAAETENLLPYVPTAFVGMGIFIFAALYWYFRQQHAVMTHAVEQIHAFIAVSYTHLTLPTKLEV